MLNRYRSCISNSPRLPSLLHRLVRLGRCRQHSLQSGFAPSYRLGFGVAIVLFAVGARHMDNTRMNEMAVEKARARLGRADQALRRIEASTTFKEFESAWSDFLLAWNSIYSVLEQGAKAKPQSRQWFGAKKRERRDDPLLQYLHQARNADEHGIEPVAVHDPGGIGIGVGGQPVEVSNLRFDEEGRASAVVKSLDGKPPKILIQGPHARPVEVVDSRYGNRYPVPREHLGKPLKRLSPLSMAQAGYAHSERLVEEAAKLPS
jgi:hypothetical protein